MYRKLLHATQTTGMYLKNAMLIKSVRDLGKPNNVIKKVSN